MSKYDIGIVGWWHNLNYGGVLTYYALNKAIEGMGYTVLMIRRSDSAGEITNDNIPLRFSKKYYNVSNVYLKSDMYELNELCDIFIVGSDQMWNPHLVKWSGPEFFLDFVYDNKKRIAYATSLGNIKKCNRDFIIQNGALLRKFNAISVREDYAVDILHADFHIHAEQVCDSIFLCGKEVYTKLAEMSRKTLPEHYLLNFVLDPSKESTDVCRYVKEKLDIERSVNFTDLQDIEEHVKSFDGEDVEANSEIEDLVLAYQNAEFVITDSYHGTCLAILFNKPFISVVNKKRGEKRFISLINWCGLKDRYVFEWGEIYEKERLFMPVNYTKVNNTIEKERNNGLGWLKKAIETPKDQMRSIILPEIQNAIDVLYQNAEFIKIRLLVTLLRDYEVKHIVLSPGGRDVPLVRMFEYNDEFFVLHRVTDERSAAYYGLGIAAQLRQPVVCVCTSGTAASNFLPAVTEAYYTGVPLIVVTADRQQVYLNQGEDQTIPQSHIYEGVIKKSITLPEAAGFKAEYQARRDISDCILETTHNGFGPVHINIAIDNITMGAKVPREYWNLLPRIYPHILRVGVNNGEHEMKKWVTELKKSNRILVVYGQNPPPTEIQLENIEGFASKYNCAIVTDFISNLDCAYSLKPYNMLQVISNDEFNKCLSPDILITVGGKRLMNDPLTFKIRGGLKNIRHWSVISSGEIKDFYFRLTSVLEISQDFFFEWFLLQAGDILNNGVYYNAWKEMTEKYSAPIIDTFNAHYIQSKFIPMVPEKALLHLGVGQSFFDSRRYLCRENVEVFCNMGTNGIDGCTSTFLGQCSVIKDRLCFLLVGDLSFFYDMNSLWNKKIDKNVRILMVNNSGSGLLRGHNLEAVAAVHNTSARGWVETVNLKYISATTKEEYVEKLKYFVSEESQEAIFFEVFCN